MKKFDPANIFYSNFKKIAELLPQRLLMKLKQKWNERKCLDMIK